MDMIHKYANTETTRYSGLNKENQSRGSDNNTKQRRSKDMNIIKVKSMIGLLFVVLFVSVSVSLSATLFSGGSGTEYDPWQIATAADLDDIRDYPDSHYVQTADIDLNSYSWTPIDGFSGSFNGIGFSISDLSIWDQHGTNIGLFGYLDGGELRNITLLNPNVIGYQYFAALAGYNDNGLIEGCAVYNGVSVGVVDPYEPLSPAMFYGGLVGYNEGLIKTSYVQSIEIMMTGIINDITETIGIYIGGLTGFNASNGIIEDCFVLNGSVSGDDYVAGLVGYNAGDVVRCYAAVSVHSQNNSGGLIAYSDYLANCANSYWNTAVSGQIYSDGGEGRTTLQMTYPYDQNTFMDWDFPFVWAADSFDGATGYPYLINNPGYYRNAPFFGAGTENNPYQIFTSLDLSNIRGWPYYHYIQMMDIDLDHSPYNEGQGWLAIGNYQSPFSGSYDGNEYLISGLYINRPQHNYQGLFGSVFGEGTIENLGVINVNVTGNLFVGALIGGSAGLSYKIKECYTSGVVNGQIFAGGVIGAAGRMYSWDCTCISDSYSTVTVSGQSYVGGLVGGNYYYSDTALYVIRSYSVGLVSGDGGGLIGGEDVNVFAQNSYWDKEASGQETSSGGIGKTSIQMLNPDTFTNWDFNDVWVFDYYNPYIRKHYPRLQWQENSGVYNMNPNAHVKVYEDRFWHWESFPRLEIENNWNYTVELLEQLLHSTTGIEIVEAQDYRMEYNYTEGPWEPANAVKFDKISGYKFGFLNDSDKYLYVSGDRVSPTVQYPDLVPFAENWVGYPLLETQDLLDAIDNIKDDVLSITGQDGGYYWEGQYWVSAYPAPKAYYGKMYIIELRGKSTVPFSWNSTRGGTEEPVIRNPRPVYFSFRDKASYEEIIIEAIDNDEGLLEIGAYIGEECIGATVFEGQYPFRVLTYPDESHANGEIQFVLHRGTRIAEEERIRVVEARNNQTGEYTRKALRPLQQRYTVIRMGAKDYTETVVTPQVIMGQNFPNPFVMSTGGSSESQYRSESVVATNIPLYLSEDMRVAISVFNIKGQIVKTITSGNLTAGKHNISWDGRNDDNQAVGAGIYFYKLESEKETINRKMLIIR